MITEEELLLTQEYNDFSMKVSQAFNEKKRLEEEFKAKFEKYKAQKAEIEKKVKEANDEWEEWKNRQMGATAASED